MHTVQVSSMEKIINNKRYNTENSELIVDFPDPNSKSNTVHTQIYLTKKGALFKVEAHYMDDYERKIHDEGALEGSVRFIKPESHNHKLEALTKDEVYEIVKDGHAKGEINAAQAERVFTMFGDVIEDA